MANEIPLRVYRDILGFRVDLILGDRPQAYSYTVFQIPREAKTRFAALRVCMFSRKKRFELTTAGLDARSACWITTGT